MTFARGAPGSSTHSHSAFTDMNPSSSIVIDGIEYVPRNQPTSGRVVMVVDRGFLFAGDVRREGDRIYLSRVKWIFKFSDIGLSAVIENPLREEVDLRDYADIEIPAHREIFSAPVAPDWGFSDGQ